MGLQKSFDGMTKYNRQPHGKFKTDYGTCGCRQYYDIAICNTMSNEYKAHPEKQQRNGDCSCVH